VAFNRKITEERNKYLNENLLSCEEKLGNVHFKLKQLNAERNKILSVLKESDSFAKFKRYQMDLVDIENEISQLLNKLDNLEALQKIAKRKMDLVRKLDKIIQDIKDHLSAPNELFKNIRSVFAELVEKIIDETAILFHRLNSSNNVEFEAKITSLEEGMLTSKSDGYTYRKMLCVCFDLSVLINYCNKNFFKFVYHDGSLESLSHTKKITYLETIRNICDEYEIQYIFTTLEDDIPKNGDGSYFIIEDQDIILTLDDDEDNKGRLFGFEF